MIESNVTGNVTSKPKLIYSDKGMATCYFSIKVKVDKEAFNFVDIVCFKELAENVAGSIENGNRVFARGRMLKEENEGKDGKTYVNLKCIANEVAASMRFNTLRMNQEPKKE